MTCCRDFGTKERESEGRQIVLGMLLELLGKDKLLHTEEPVNAELRPLRREKRGRRSVIWHFERVNEDVTE